MTAAERRPRSPALRASGAGRPTVTMVMLGAAVAVIAIAVPIGIVLERVLLGPVVAEQPRRTGDAACSGQAPDSSRRRDARAAGDRRGGGCCLGRAPGRVRADRGRAAGTVGAPPIAALGAVAAVALVMFAVAVVALSQGSARGARARRPWLDAVEHLDRSRRQRHARGRSWRAARRGPRTRSGAGGQRARTPLTLWMPRRPRPRRGKSLAGRRSPTGRAWPRPFATELLSAQVLAATLGSIACDRARRPARDLGDLIDSAQANELHQALAACGGDPARPAMTASRNSQIPTRSLTAPTSTRRATRACSTAPGSVESARPPRPAVVSGARKPRHARCRRRLRLERIATDDRELVRADRSLEAPERRDRPRADRPLSRRWVAG